jgi:hypothetical protein
MSVTVAFLARGLGTGLPAVEAFFESYKAHPAGAPHRLVLLVKGWEGVPGRDRLNGMAEAVGAELLELPDDGFDWGAYFRLAEVAETEFVLLLNSHSRIQRDNWLGLMLAVMRQPGVGLVGCTGSWGTIGLTWRYYWILAKARWKAGSRIRLIVFVFAAVLVLTGRLLHTFHRFPPHPNPHIRSNAMLLPTASLRDFAARRRVPARKKDAYALESGRRGLTRFVAAQRLATLVCGADGRGYRPTEWVAAETFFTPGQRNLLIADNQTRNYSEGSIVHRRALEALVWGRYLTEPEHQ